MNIILDVPYEGIIIAGPTASGKSSFAIEIGQKFISIGQPIGIINADSMQVYSDLPVLTARPRESDVNHIPHYLYGIINAHQKGSVKWWLDCINDQLENCKQQKIFPIIVGGTGLYLKALTQGLSVIPPIQDAVKQQVKEIAQNLGQDFYSYVCDCDFLVKGLLSPNDHQRLMRALEVYIQTSQSIFWWQKQTSSPKRRFLYYLLDIERKKLYQNIDIRFDQMMNKGALEEVKNLLTTNPLEDSPIFKAIGVQELTAYLKGEINLETAINLAKRNSRRYAKRQLTWFHHQVSDKIPLNSLDINRIWPFLKEKLKVLYY